MPIELKLPFKIFRRRSKFTNSHLVILQHEVTTTQDVYRFKTKEDADYVHAFVLLGANIHNLIESYYEKNTIYHRAKRPEGQRS